MYFLQHLWKAAPTSLKPYLILSQTPVSCDESAFCPIELKSLSHNKDCLMLNNSVLNYETRARTNELFDSDK